MVLVDGLNGIGLDQDVADFIVIDGHRAFRAGEVGIDQKGLEREFKPFVVSLDGTLGIAEAGHSALSELVAQAAVGRCGFRDLGRCGAWARDPRVESIDRRAHGNDGFLGPADAKEDLASGLFCQCERPKDSWTARVASVECSRDDEGFIEAAESAIWLTKKLI